MRMMLIAIACFAALLLASPMATAQKLDTKTLEVDHAGTKLKCFLAFDPSHTGKRPAVLVFPEWWGLNDYARSRATQLAQAGYVALAVDMYGDGKTADNREGAQALAGKFYSDPKLMRDRTKAALEALVKQPNVDPKKVAAIGYCFGGTCALELARSGADIAGTVSFHGGLDTKDPADAKNIKGKVMICTGGNDPMVDGKEREACIKEMETAGVDYRMIVYGGAKHAFTNPAADKAGIPGVGYQKEADERSWTAMMKLFQETIGGGAGHVQ